MTERQETVAYYDFQTQKLVQIPKSELVPGMVQAKIEGIDEIVWISPDQLQQGKVKNPPFDEEVRSLLEIIRETFHEHRPASLEEWEDGFRRDSNPEQEIAIWLHAASVYKVFAIESPAAEKRQEIYRVIVSCMTTSPDNVQNVLTMNILSRAEVAMIADHFFGNSAK